MVPLPARMRKRASRYIDRLLAGIEVRSTAVHSRRAEDDVMALVQVDRLM